MLLPVMSYYDTVTKSLVHQTIAPKNEKQPIWANHIGAYLPELFIQILDEDNATVPTRENLTDAGLDLYAAEDVLIERIKPDYNDDDHRVLVSTGIACEIPPGLGLFLWDRSGLSVKHGIHRVAGVIDSSYRGEIKVALVNLTSDPYQIHKGDKIAQGVLAPIIIPRIRIVSDLSESKRGKKGFGSSGR